MSDKKGKAKSQNLPRRQRKAKSSKSARVRLSQGSKTSNSSTVAVNVQRRNPATYSNGVVTHPKYGKGMRFVGTQMLTNAVTTASDSQLWTGTAPATTQTINFIYLSPDVFNSRLALQASTYSLYRFTDVIIEYEPLVATSQAGGFALCISADPFKATVAITNYATCQEIVPSITSPFREKATLHYHYDKEELFYNYAASATTADVRVSYQAVIAGFPSSSSLGALTMGTFRLRYVVEFYGETTNENLASLARCSLAEQKLAIEAVQASRASSGGSSDGKEVRSLVPVPVTRQVASGSTSSTSAGVVASTSSQGLLRSVDDNYVLVKRA